MTSNGSHNNVMAVLWFDYILDHNLPRQNIGQWKLSDEVSIFALWLKYYLTLSPKFARWLFSGSDVSGACILWSIPTQLYFCTPLKLSKRSCGIFKAIFIFYPTCGLCLQQSSTTKFFKGLAVESENKGKNILKCYPNSQI